MQMHSAARTITQTLMRKSTAAFGKLFSCSKVYSSTMEGLPVTVEDFIDGNFDNNNGNISEPKSPNHRILIEKAECLVHFSFVDTKKQMMLLDLQGVGYTLCDPEIATQDLLEDGELNFGTGHLASDAIDSFLVKHNCNQFYKMLDLQNSE